MIVSQVPVYCARLSSDSCRGTGLRSMTPRYCSKAYTRNRSLNSGPFGPQFIIAISPEVVFGREQDLRLLADRGAAVCHHAHIVDVADQ